MRRTWSFVTSLVTLVVPYGTVVIVVFRSADQLHDLMSWVLGDRLQSTLLGWTVNLTVLLCWYGGAFRRNRRS